MERSSQLRKLTTMGMMAAVSIILVYLIHFPIFPAASFLEYDPADIPIFICTFLYGPLSGFILTVIVSFIQGFTVSAQSGIIGVMMHIFATGFFTIVAGNMYIDELRSPQSKHVDLHNTARQARMSIPRVSRYHNNS